MPRPIEVERRINAILGTAVENLQFQDGVTTFIYQDRRYEAYTGWVGRANRVDRQPRFPSFYAGGNPRKFSPRTTVRSFSDSSERPAG